MQQKNSFLSLSLHFLRCFFQIFIFMSFEKLLFFLQQSILFNRFFLTVTQLNQDSSMPMMLVFKLADIVYSTLGRGFELCYQEYWGDLSFALSHSFLLFPKVSLLNCFFFLRMVAPNMGINTNG